MATADGPLAKRVKREPSPDDYERNLEDDLAMLQVRAKCNLARITAILLSKLHKTRSVVLFGVRNSNYGL